MIQHLFDYLTMDINKEYGKLIETKITTLIIGSSMTGLEVTETAGDFCGVAEDVHYRIRFNPMLSYEIIFYFTKANKKLTAINLYEHKGKGVVKKANGTASANNLYNPIKVFEKIFMETETKQT